MHQRTVGIDLGVDSLHVAVVWEEDGQRIIEVIKFDLYLKELVRIERAAIAGSAEGTELYVVMEKTYPAYQYVSKFFLDRCPYISISRVDAVFVRRGVGELPS